MQSRSECKIVPASPAGIDLWLRVTRVSVVSARIAEAIKFSKRNDSSNWRAFY